MFRSSMAIYGELGPPTFLKRSPAYAETLLATVTVIAVADMKVAIASFSKVLFINIVLLLVSWTRQVLSISTGNVTEAQPCGENSQGRTPRLKYCGSGSVRIIYPFWIRNRNCNVSGDQTLLGDFELDCEETTGKLYLKNAVSMNDPAKIEVVEMKVNENTLVVDVSNVRVSATDCFSTKKNETYSTLSLKPYPGPLVMASDNMLLSYGCATGDMYTANLKPGADQDYDDIDYEDYVGQYLQSSCSILAKDVSNPVCNGSTCCTVAFPPTESSSIRYAAFSSSASLQYKTDNTVCDISTSCNSSRSPFASLFHPELSDVSRNLFRIRIWWAIPWNFSVDSSDHDPPSLQKEDNVSQMIRKSPDYACHKEYASLTLVPSVPGYICSCNAGYSGDGYVNGLGCADVNECIDPTQNSCIPGSSTCHNLEGHYLCKCNSWLHTGDGHSNGTGCQLSQALIKALGVIGGMLVLVLVLGSTTVLLVVQHKKMTRKKNFVQHGGLQLEAYIARQGGAPTRKIFTEKELIAATDNYSNDMKLGSGGFGTVYRGVLTDRTMVAIKKAHIKNWKPGRKDNDFVNEMLILMQINHKNIVRLLGCCIETETPLLVYEYLSNGTLAENLLGRDQNVSIENNLSSHSDNNSHPVNPINKYLQDYESKKRTQTVNLNWEQRLKVARQIAEALAYLHQAISPPIIHRDLKPANVLLDDMYDAKVADFGLSKLMNVGCEDQAEAELHKKSKAVVQGTLGYIDPEYFHSLQFTSKSDVYSFGVLLVELITGLKVIDQTRESKFVSLAKLFAHHMQESTLHSIIDQRLKLGKDNKENISKSSLSSSVMEAANLALSCLSLVGSMRPSMQQITDELGRILAKRSDSGCDSQQSISIYGSHSESGSTSSTYPLDHSSYKYTDLSSSYSTIDHSDVSLTIPR